MTLSLLVIACTEEARLAGCIASCRSVVDEVVVVVQESRDRTLAIANRLADTVVADGCHGFCEPSRGLGLSACAGEWVLNLDADETLTPFAVANIREQIARTKADMLLLRHLTRIDGQVIADVARPRLFRRHCVECPKEIHSVFGLRHGAPQTVSGPVWIDHTKSWAEQHLDDARYAQITS